MYEWRFLISSSVQSFPLTSIWLGSWSFLFDLKHFNINSRWLCWNNGSIHTINVKVLYCIMLWPTRTNLVRTKEKKGVIATQRYKYDSKCSLKISSFFNRRKRLRTSTTYSNGKQYLHPLVGIIILMILRMPTGTNTVSIIPFS